MNQSPLFRRARLPLLAVIGVGAFLAVLFVWSPSTFGGHSANATPTSTPDLTSSWKTYADTFDGYSVKYPADWFLVPASGPMAAAYLTNYDLSKAVGTGPLDSTHYKIDLTAVPNSQNLTAEQYIQQSDSNASNNRGQMVTVVSDTPTTINGVSGRLREVIESGEGANQPWSELFLPGNGKIYLLSAPKNASFDATFQTLINTVKVSQIYEQINETPASPGANGKISKTFNISFSGTQLAKSSVVVDFPAPNVGQSGLLICANLDNYVAGTPCTGTRTTGESGLDSQNVSVAYSFKVYVNGSEVSEWGGSTMMTGSSTITTSYNWG